MSYSQMWLTAMEAGVGRNIVYPDTPLGYIHAVKYNTWASNAVTARAMAIASVPMKLYKKPEKPTDKPEEVLEHPVLDLLVEVNPVNLDRTSYREQIQRQKAIHGTAYTLIVPGLDDEPKELYILPAHLVEKVPDPHTFIRGYRYAGQFYPVEWVMRDYYMDDADPREARSPTAAAIAAINRYNLADLTQESLDKRGGQGGGIVGVNFNQIEGDSERFMQEWRSHRADPRNAGDDAFLPFGFSYEQGTLTAEQQQRELRMQRLIHEIAAAYWVPPSLMGDYSDASVLANALQQSVNFWQTCGIAEATRMAEVHTFYLLWAHYPGSKEEGLYLAADLSGVAALQDDETKAVERDRTKVETAGTGVTGGLWSVNEGRERLGMQRIDNPAADDVMVISQRLMDRAGTGQGGPGGVPAGSPAAKAAPMEPRDGVMIGFFLSTHDARQIAPTADELPAEVQREDTLHVTLAFVGQATDLADRRVQLAGAVNLFADAHYPITGTVNGVGRFTATGAEADALYANFDSADLPAFRHELVEALGKAGFGIADLHGFTPHITFAYLPKDMPTPDLALTTPPPPALPARITFAALTLAWGNEHEVFPLSGGATRIVGPVPGGMMSAEMPVTDFVGQTAVLPDDSRQPIEAIKRFGEFVGPRGEALKAEKGSPVVIVAGQAYRASDVRVLVNMEVG
jgi:HK97 family phage portal protein